MAILEGLSKTLPKYPWCPIWISEEDHLKKNQILHPLIKPISVQCAHWEEWGQREHCSGGRDLEGVHLTADR